MSTPTPHIGAQKGDFAKTVLMPGDPLRAKVIAESYLRDIRLVNEVRGMLGFTGTYKGKPVSVMGSGMGMPSIGIYSYELFHFYDVDNIIRVGSAGAIADGVKLYDVVVGMGACTNSSYAQQFNLPGTFAPIASYELLTKISAAAAALNIPLKVGNLLSSDPFYDDANSTADWQKMGVLAVEMEAAALYLNAARAGKHAAAICTVSDEPLTGAATTAEERQNSFRQMMEIALDAAVL